MSLNMSDDRRQLLGVRAIRVTLASALRHATPEQRDLCIGRARQLLAHVREEATASAVIAEIEAMEAQLPTSAEADQREG